MKTMKEIPSMSKKLTLGHEFSMDSEQDTRFGFSSGSSRDNLDGKVCLSRVPPLPNEQNDGATSESSESSVSYGLEKKSDFSQDRSQNSGHHSKMGLIRESSLDNSEESITAMSHESLANSKHSSRLDLSREFSIEEGQDTKPLLSSESSVNSGRNNRAECVSGDQPVSSERNAQPRLNSEPAQRNVLSYKTDVTFKPSVSSEPDAVPRLSYKCSVSSERSDVKDITDNPSVSSDDDTMPRLSSESSVSNGRSNRTDIRTDPPVSSEDDTMPRLRSEPTMGCEHAPKPRLSSESSVSSGQSIRTDLTPDNSVSNELDKKTHPLYPPTSGARSKTKPVHRRSSLRTGQNQNVGLKREASMRSCLSRESSMSNLMSRRGAISLESSKSRYGSQTSLSSRRSGGKKWSAKLIFMAMELRMLVDMAELFEKNKTYKPPRPQGDDTSDDTDDESADAFKDKSPSQPTTPTSPPSPTPTTRPPPPPYHTIVMDGPTASGDEGQTFSHRYPNVFGGAASVNNARDYDTGPIAKGSSIEMDSFRTSPVAVGEEGRGVGGPGGREDVNGRVAEIGIVLPIVPRPPDTLSTGADGGGGDGGTGGGGDKPPGSEFSDEKTPLQGPTEDFEKRDNWDKKADFLLSVIGYAVDLANVWRFPYLCYKNGGGAFLVPYFGVLMFGAMPVFFMEMCMGQFHRKGPITVWKMVPMFKGIGMASCFMAYIVAFYYNIIIGWSFFYLFSSFSASLPWTSCNNPWNSPRCWESQRGHNGTTVDNRTFDKNTSVSSTLEFFERGVLSVHKSTGLDDLGHVRWQLVLCTLLTFCLLYFCLWKGVKTTGKVVYLTATMPYIILTILLVRGVMLPGARDGIRFFITPDLTKLGDPQVWIDAAVQIFFSVGAGFGTHIAYASYNKFNNNCQRDCIVTVIVNSFTSIFSGFVIFSYLGYMSNQTQKDISQVATEGPGLVFNVYPEAIATLPGSTGWAIIFFFMLLTLGIDSAFGGLESPLTGLYDELKGLLKLRYFREILTLVVVGSAFLCSIPCLTEGGIYVFTILDTFAAGTSILFTVLCQVIAVSWFYGIKQFCRDIERMTGSQPSIYWRICWKFICPILLLIIVISSIISYIPLAYSTADGVYKYPFYANVIGWCVALSSMLLIPGYALYKVLRTPGTLRERLAYCISPEWEHEEIRQKKYVRRYHKEHWLSI